MFTMREALRPFVRSRCRACGDRRIADHVDVIAREGRAHYAGLAVCGSVWECPACMLAIKTERATELDRLADWHGRGRCVMATLTLRHGFGDDLGQLRRALSKAWELVQQGRAWKRWKKKVGFVGSVRALEVTHGYVAGWHPHLHVLFLVEDAKDPRWAGWENELRARWIAACERLTETDRPKASRWSRLEPVKHALGAEADALFRALDRARLPMLERSQIPDWNHGVVLTYGTKESYVTKLGLELSDAGGKHAKEGRRTPLAIAADLVRAGRTRDGELWRTYSKAFFRARCLTWSKGLKDAAGIAEVTDEEAATCRVGEWICRVDGPTWDSCRRQHGFKAGLLEAVELGGAERARLFVEIAGQRAARSPPPPKRKPGDPIPWRELRDTPAENDTGPGLITLSALEAADAELNTPAMLALRARSDEWYSYRHRERLDDAKARLLGQYVPGTMRGDELGGPVRFADPKTLAAVRRRYRLAVEGLDPMKTPTADPDTTPPPCDLDAEAAVLSAFLLTEKWAPIDLEAEDFYSVANRRIFEILQVLASEGSPLDVVTVARRARVTGGEKQIGGSAYLARILDATPSIENVGAHAAIVKETRIARDLIGFLHRCTSDLYAGSDPKVIAGRIAEACERARRGERDRPGNVLPLRGRSG